MNDKQEKARISGGGTILTFSLIMFFLSFAWMIYEIFITDTDIVVLSAIFTFLGDSSGFLTFLCVVMIAMSLLRSQKQYHTTTINLINIVLLNRLYLNSRWRAIYESIRAFLLEQNWASVSFFGVLFIVAGYCIYVGWKQRRKNSGKRPNASPALDSTPPAHTNPQQVPDGTAPNGQNTAQQSSNSEVTVFDPAAGQTSGTQSAPPSTPNGPAAPGQSNNQESASVSSVLFYIFEELLA